MNAGTINEKELSFQDLIDDAVTIIQYFSSQNKFKKIIIVGHSEGSLIGIIAARGYADGFVSLAGSARSADVLIEEQIATNAPALLTEVRQYFSQLKSGKTFELQKSRIGCAFSGKCAALPDLVDQI